MKASEGVHLTYLVPNDCYVFLWGKALVPMDGQTLFPDEDEAKEAARRCRLKVEPGGLVQPIKPPTRLEMLRGEFEQLRDNRALYSSQAVSQAMIPLIGEIKAERTREDSPEWEAFFKEVVQWFMGDLGRKP